ncbi:MAG: hypothetical protein GX945_15475 [Lentisphaerae bacterium]|jgi:hypothetical protein|nr:hypothetical protein [Lentisphaerota bacterium]
MTLFSPAESRLYALAGRLNAMALAMALSLFVFSGPVFHSRPWPLLRYGQVLPVALLSLCLLTPMPASPPLIGLRLRASCLTVLGLSPFLTWYLRSDGQVYFAFCTLLLTGATLWLLLEISLWLRRLATDAGNVLLRKLAQNSVSLVLFGAIVPVSAIHLAFLLLLSGVDNGWSALDLHIVWASGPAHIGLLLRVLFFWIAFHVGALCLFAGLYGQRQVHRRLFDKQEQDHKELDE